jgi:hypothetical protein
MDGQRTGRWVQNMATTRRVGGICRFPGLGGGHWRRAMGADRLPGNRRCGDGAACTRITLENLSPAALASSGANNTAPPPFFATATALAFYCFFGSPEPSGTQGTRGKPKGRIASISEALTRALTSPHLSSLLEGSRRLRAPDTPNNSNQFISSDFTNQIEQCYLLLSSRQWNGRRFNQMRPAAPTATMSHSRLTQT